MLTTIKVYCEQVIQAAAYAYKKIDDWGFHKFLNLCTLRKLKFASISTSTKHYHKILH